MLRAVHRLSAPDTPRRLGAAATRSIPSNRVFTHSVVFYSESRNSKQIFFFYTIYFVLTKANGGGGGGSGAQIKRSSLRFQFDLFLPVFVKKKKKIIPLFNIVVI